MPVGTSCATTARHRSGALFVDNSASFEARDPDTDAPGNDLAYRITGKRIEPQRLVTHSLNDFKAPWRPA